jgi:hypothetical protein
MDTPSRPKPGPPPASKSAGPQDASPPLRPRAGVPAAAQPAAGPTGGVAVWDWLKNTGRQAIDSTSRLLKKLEAPELKVEQTHDEELRIMPDAGPGGGYDPYNQATKPRKPGSK